MFCMRLCFREITTAENVKDVWKCEPRKNCCLTWYSSEESIVLEKDIVGVCVDLNTFSFDRVHRRVALLVLLPLSDLGPLRKCWAVRL